MLRRFAEAVDGDREHLAALEVANSGHTIGNARWEAGNVRDVIAYYSGSPERLAGQQIPVAGGVDVTFHEPMGVIGAIVPWNFPIPIASWAFAPALAAGNSWCSSPPSSRRSPRCAWPARAVGRDPGGVFQVVPGRGAVVGERLVDHPDVAKIVLHRFDGGRRVGDGRLRAAHQAGDPGARRQERQHRVRRRRRGRPPRPARRTRCSTTPVRTVAPARGSWCSAAASTASWRSSKRPCAACRGRSRRRALRDGAADQRGAPGPSGVLRGR